MLLIALPLIASCGGSNGGGGEGGTSAAAAVNTIGTVTLQWTTPALNVDGEPMTVAGYKIYYGTESGVYTNVIDIQNTTTYTVSGLPVGYTYFFAITAYDADRVESDPTDEQAITPPVFRTGG
jgi:Fibronectin type III domain.